MEQGLKQEIDNFLNNYDVRFEPNQACYWVFVDYEVKGVKKKAYSKSRSFLGSLKNPELKPELLNGMLKDVRTQIENDLEGRIKERPVDEDFWRKPWSDD